jgi:uracil-DNA glycosylase
MQLPFEDRAFYESAAPLVPEGAALSEVAEAARGCQACHLWRRGTQTVFGEGPPKARLMLVGEQPGDREDLEGRPFVGPAGQVLAEALEKAGIERSEVYVTNVVKHFKWIPKGNRRLHQKPNRQEVVACRPWLDAEIALIEPQGVLLLGATAAQALLGAEFRLTRHRGEFVPSPLAPFVMATLHPSAILRTRDTSERSAAKASLAEDLGQIWSKILA